MNIVARLLADENNPGSLAARARAKRFKKLLLVLNLLSEKLDHKINLLDVGGTAKFWVMREELSLSHRITLLNVVPIESSNNNIVCKMGDARNMDQFADGEFDIAFSNSVIEHVGTRVDQKNMAREMRRVASVYFLQTPNFFFFLEPHFIFPFFHWFPREIRIWLIRHFSLGWYPKIASFEEAAKIVDNIRLIKYRELRNLFPDAMILRERFMGMTKSFIVIKNVVVLGINWRIY
jgi:hypothetical protein